MVESVDNRPAAGPTIRTMSSVAEPAAPPPPQELRFCRAADGTRIAYATHGSGPPLVVASCWMSHLQFDWQSPVWRHFLEALGEIATVIRYDERGHGLSDWDVDDFSTEARLSDLEAVVDDAGVGRFALLAMSQGGPIAIMFAARHPERVSRLIFYSSYAAAYRDATPDDLEMVAALDQLTKVGWERPTPEFRRVFTFQMIPGASEEQMRWLDELQRMSTSAEVSLRARKARRTADAVELLPQITAPTLVIHGRDDHMNKFDEGVFLAANIAGARLVPLESQNHIVLGDEPAWPVFIDEVTEFLAPERVPTPPTSGPNRIAALSARELDVLRLVADGADNDWVADELIISVRTVERHLQNIYVKLGVAGRSARTAAATALLRSAGRLRADL
jgi:pimeloyl-ACP methyl ester carboxylesterase/DNA-binding CsgD family transcriptional regulator